MRRLPLVLGLVLVLSCAWALPALAGSSDDQDIADSSVLTKSDVADYGLQATDPSDDSTPSGGVCKGIRASEAAADDAPSAVSSFTDYIGTNVEDHVSVFDSVKQAKAAFAPYLTAKALKCAERSLKEGLQDLPDGSSARYNGERQEIPVGDGGIVLPITLEITAADGETSTSVIELGVFRVGRALVSMSTLNPGEPFPGSEQLATLIADNLASNL